MNEIIEQLRRNRKHGLNSWMAGGTPDGSPRWSEDDSRRLSEHDLLRMRLDLADNKGTSQQRTLWQKIIDAEQVRFTELDDVYEAAKAALVEE